MTDTPWTQRDASIAAVAAGISQCLGLLLHAAAKAGRYLEQHRSEVVACYTELPGDRPVGNDIGARWVREIDDALDPLVETLEDIMERMSGIEGETERLLTAASAAPDRPPFDLVAHLRRQMAFSARTFGPGDRTAGVCDHIRKELVEVEGDAAAGLPTLPEWVDVIILALDGAWRSGATPEQIVAAIAAKQTRNEARIWPDWRQADPGKAIEHVRDGEAGRAAVPPPSETAALRDRVQRLEGLAEHARTVLLQSGDVRAALGVLSAMLLETPAPSEAPARMTDAEIDNVLSELDDIASESALYQFGLPMHDDGSLQRMRAAVRKALGIPAIRAGNEG